MEISEFNDFSGLLEKFSPAAQRRAIREAARYLMLSNRKRLKQNIEASGAAMTSRKNGNSKMFQKMGQSMRQQDSTSESSVGFYGNVGRIATNHQMGKVLKRILASGRVIDINLPVRLLLGLDDEDRHEVNQIFLKHMSM